MASDKSPLTDFRDKLQRGELDPLAAAERALASANSNQGRNVYLSLDSDWVLEQAKTLPQRFPAEKPALYGIPVSMKDCFDLSGFPTTCGSRFYAGYNGLAKADSWAAEKLRSRGAVITGKTHLHQLAYGITGENPDYGDCHQPRDPARLTGGSSSGAAASIQEGSAMAAIGTDTGGSIRAPAALCGLAGYRSSLGLGGWRGDAHLAESFDTIGWLFRDLRDAPLLAHALLDLPLEIFPAGKPVKIGSIDMEFLHDCEAPVLAAFESFCGNLESLGHAVHRFDSSVWKDSFDIFSAIQASEAAVIHAVHSDRFDPAIGERLRWGASISPEELRLLRHRHKEFRDGFDRLFGSYDFLVLPCAPVTALIAGADQSAARKRILRYTTPASLAGAPVVALPLEGAGVQLIGRHGSDAGLVAFAAQLASLSFSYKHQACNAMANAGEV